MNKKEEFTDTFTKLSDEDKIRDFYKIIDVNWLDPTLVKSKIIVDDGDYFKYRPKKEEILNNMLKYYLNHKDAGIYKKTEYLCNKKEEICICNLHADEFRKIYDEHNYSPGEKYISWFRKIGD